MQLTKLEIKGFKSFGDKITIHFNSGVTAIVGPNGCGKSNVVDAIRWVLGEQSTRMLRSEKMENIIFNGTKTRRPSNLAEVSLTFDNTKNLLPTDFSQITITRKLYRTGESEYRINDVQCRLKDITDLFLDTGVGSDSYSIIELKMIDEIIANKEGSRRLLFEEASGISKYKLRKKQTFSKLKDTEADLSRVEDLLFEIEKNLKTLENQAKKAERYHQLKENYKSLSAKLAAFQIVDLRGSLEKLEQQEEAQHVEKTSISTQIDTIEAVLEQQKLDHITKEKNLSIQQKISNEYTNKIRTYESDKKLKSEQLRFAEEKNEKLIKDLALEKNRLNDIVYNLKRLNDELIHESELQTLIQRDLETHQTEVEQLQINQKADKLALDVVIKDNEILQNQIYSFEKELAVFNIQKEALEQESKRNMADTESKETALNEFSKLIASLTENIAMQKSNLDILEKQESERLQQLVETNDLITLQKEQLSAESRALDAKQNEYNLTKSLVDNLEGFPESIRFLKKNANWGKQATLLSDVFYCKEEYRVPLENYLEPVMNHYVVETQADAVQAIRLLSDSAKGRASFFVLEAFKASQQQAITPAKNSQLIAALDIIDVDATYYPLCQFLLQHVYLLTSPSDEALEAILPEKHQVILSSSGKFAKSKVVLSGGSIGLFDGKRIGRAKNLESLAKEIKVRQATTLKLKEALERESGKLKILQSSSSKQDIQQFQNTIHRLTNELTSVQTRQEQHVAFIENTQTRKQDIAQKIISIDEELSQKEPQLIIFKKQKQEKAVYLIEKQQTYQQLADKLTAKSALYNQENIRFHQQKNKVNTIEKDLKRFYEQEQEVNEKIKINGEELQKSESDITNILQHATHSDEDLTVMYAEKEALEKGLEEFEQVYYASRALIIENEGKISQLRKHKDQAEVLTNELKDKKNILKLELNALKERLSIEFAIDIADLLENDPPKGENETDLREKIVRIKRQLDDFGAINPMAMEAYQEISERHKFIQVQKKDLLDAKISLMQTIKEIDDTAREKFMEAFTACKTHFVTVFRSLFNEEDFCDLILVNPSNPLESDIDIIAKPKGKRPLSINQLSGGEKTLTATALLFSLYLLKPAPFCIFDEVDAPLDDTNIDKFNNIIRKFSDQSQFIVVSHNKRTIANTDIIYGVTMVEQGISRVVAVDMQEVA